MKVSRIVAISIWMFLALQLVMAQENEKRMVIPENELAFRANEDFTEVTITNFKGDVRDYDGAVMEIPATIQGIPVTEIGRCAFSNSDEIWYSSDYQEIEKLETSIEELYIPDGVKIIGEGAFRELRAKTLRIPQSLQKVGEKAFASNFALLTVKIPKNTDIFEAGAFSDCMRLENIIFEDGIEKIPKRMFESCGIKTLSFPPSLKVVEENAFRDCYLLETLILNEGLERIEGYAFSGVSPKSISLPQSLCFLSEDAFYKADVEEVIVPENFNCFSDDWRENDCTLLDIFNCTAIMRNLALQKKLKGIVLRNEKKFLREQEEALIKAQKASVLPSFTQELLASGELQKVKWIGSGKLIFVIPCKNYENGYFVLKSSDGNDVKLSEKEVMNQLNAVTGKKFSMHPLEKGWFYRDATDDEKKAYTQQQRLLEFERGEISTNLVNKYDSSKLVVSFTEKKNSVTVTAVEDNSCFAQAGLQKNDVIKAISVMLEDGSTKKIEHTDLLSVPAPATIELTVQRGKGKKTQTLDIKIAVKWNVRD